VLLKFLHLLEDDKISIWWWWWGSKNACQKTV